MSVIHSDEAVAQVNQIEIVYDTFGNKNDPPLLMIMGLGGQLVNWDEEFCLQLASYGYWVIRYDNRDIGLSTKFHDAGVPDIRAITRAVIAGQEVKPAYTLSDMADDAAGLMDVLSIDSAHVIGVSMGGMIAQVLSLNHSDRVKTLTSIMSSTNEPDLPMPKQEAFMILIIPAPQEREAYIEYSYQSWQVLDGTKHRQDETYIRAKAGIAFDRGLCPEGTARQLSAVIATPGRREALQAVTIPTLVIHGSDDPLVPVECGRDTARSIPSAEMKIIEGMGHSIPKSLHSEVVTAIVKNTLR